MELTLTRQVGTQVQVACDGQPSHSFDLQPLVPAAEGQPGLPQPLKDPVIYGKAAFQALFPANSLARRVLDAMPDRILLVTTDNDIDAVPWEYAYGPDGFLVANYPFARGLPPDQRLAPPALDTGLHVVAIPSDPLDKGLNPLNIEGEWTRLKEIISQVPNAVTLERAYPPTIEQVRSQVANRRHRVAHFMGHGGQDDDIGAFLCLEKENGTLDPVTARQFVLRLRGSVFLVTLSACVSATPGPTQFSNLAAALVRQKVPYALGMRLSIHDDDARAFSRRFYSELASGVPVEEALFQARLTLADSPRKWAIGIPVLYTSLSQPAGGFAAQAGAPTIEEHRPPVETIALPRAEGGFQGRIDELAWLGDKLTGDERPPIITIHGSGGQGKTALACEAIERFAFAWPGGIWAISLENLPSREVFLTNLARFLGLPVQEITRLEDLERQVLLRLSQGQPRTLIVLDNVETLIEAAHANDIAATNLAQFIRTHLTRPPVSLLVTSRRFLDWQGELDLELEGLQPDEGAKLFQQSAPRRLHDIEPALAEELSRKVAGHPLSLRLLGGAFNQITLSLPEFIRDCDTHLLAAEDKYAGIEHRHRTLYACIETSVRYLDADLLQLFGRLWIFHAPFLPETAVEIFDPDFDNTTGERSPIYDQLHALWLRGLLVFDREILREGTVECYGLPPTIRTYIENCLARAEEHEVLLAYFGATCTRLVRFLFNELDRGGVAAFIAEQSREDLERGASYVIGIERGYYQLWWGWVLHRLGYSRRGLQLTEQGLEIVQGSDQLAESQVLSNMAAIYLETGQPKRALELLEQALLYVQELEDKEGKATVLNNMASAYHAMGQRGKALALFEQALLLDREVRDQRGEAVALINMAGLYRTAGQPERALELFEQALPLIRDAGNRIGEAVLLSSSGGAYYLMGQPEKALELLEQALPIMREVGAQTEEAKALANTARVYSKMGQPERALELFEQALLLLDKVGERAEEIATLSDMAMLLYKYMNRRQDAIVVMQQAISILDETDLFQDAHGHTRDRLEQYLDAMYRGVTPEQVDQTAMAAAQLQIIVHNTVAVMTTMQERRAEWHETLTDMLQEVKQQGVDRQADVDLYTAVLTLLDGQVPSLPSDHFYADVLARIQAGIAAGSLLDDELPTQTESSISLFEMIVSNTLAVLGPLPEKLPEWRAALLQLKKQAIQTNEQQLVCMLEAIVGLLDARGNPAGLGADLDGEYAQVWQALVEALGT